ncbi:FadR/GntR family transcriptional regulator [Paraglaciecola aquimarina]|uniref:FadR/GntR family transcriptional regulator n=1 Tax=Paraglaciecola aquimarina TaxID=1235557 RepID=A0ABU3STS3_9ALTE|nr:FadR/GntR family transcriptional regulator [Paraglaciecola aquimarina]MDU0353416.1 FadR/GntR family transcriptional regulator [Paraglaciecola aquimarina]
MSNTEHLSQRLYLQIADKLAELVKNGEVKVGARFAAERDLAAEFGVSRSTIREAMIALEVSGLVEIRSGSGIYALDPSRKMSSTIANEDMPDPFEVLEARMLLEAESAKMAAERISNDELLQLKQILLSMSVAIEQGNIEEAERIDHAFHLAIVTATRNGALVPIYEWLWQVRELSEVSKRFHLKLRDKGSTPKIDEHKAVCDALMQRDGEKAKAAIEAHLSNVMSRLSACTLV